MLNFFIFFVGIFLLILELIISKKMTWSIFSSIPLFILSIMLRYAYKSYKEEFKVFVETSNHLVKTLKENLVETDASNALNTINKLRKNLLYLESFSKIPMETNAMKNYIDAHSAGKQSGSGSGDIVLGFEKNNDKYQLQLNLEKL